MSTKIFETPPPSLKGYRFPSPPRRVHKPIKVLNGYDLKPINLNKEIFSGDAWLHISLDMLLEMDQKSSVVIRRRSKRKRKN